MKKLESFINRRAIAYLILIVALTASAAQGQTEAQPNDIPPTDGVAIQPTSFTYQGRLSETGGTSGTYDFQFALFSQFLGGTAIGTTTKTGVSVVNGIFTVELDFGLLAFPDEERYLEIRVKRPAEANYTPLTPRQKITSAPFALRSLRSKLADEATTALNAQAVGNTRAANIIKEGDSRLTDARLPAPNSGNYIQNQNSNAQTSTNFRIDGTGTADIFNAQTQFNIGGERVFKVDMNDENLFVGRNTGTANTNGFYNVFVGENTGQSNNIGRRNSFFGYDAGFANTDGDENAFFGQGAGRSNISGSNNSFFGQLSGNANTMGNSNAFFGSAAGETNTTSGGNTFVGAEAGRYSTGSDNTFIGAFAGYNNSTGSKNTALGESAVVSGNLTFATVVGAGATVNNSNSVVLGRTADTVRIPGNLNLTGTFSGNFTVPAANVTGTFSQTQIPNLDAGKITGGTFDAARIPNLGASYIQNTTTQQTGSFNVNGTGAANIFNAMTQYNIGGNRVLSVAGTNNTFAGIGAGAANGAGDSNSFFGGGSGFGNTSGIWNSFFGVDAGRSNINANYNAFFGTRAGYQNNESGSGGNENVFFGVDAGTANTTGTGNSFFGTAAGFINKFGNYNTLVGWNANVSTGNLNYASAVGAGALVSQNDSIVLGKTAGTYAGVARPADTVRIPGDMVVGGNVKVGTTGNLSAVAGEENLRIVRGHIQVSGGNATVFSGSGFTVTRNQTGVFTITFTTPFAGDIVLTPTVLNFFNAPQTAILTYISESEVRVNVFASNGTLTDPLSLLFIAVGTR